MNRYLIKLYYIDKKISKYEFKNQETLFFGEDETIADNVIEYLKRLKKNFNFKVDDYSIYKYIVSNKFEDKKGDE